MRLHETFGVAGLLLPQAHLALILRRSVTLRTQGLRPALMRALGGIVIAPLALATNGMPASLAVVRYQAQPQIVLPGPNGRSHHEFEQIESIRELSDGRVLVLDRSNAAGHLIAVDFITGVDKIVGRMGAGPGEYRNPRSLVPLGADSSLLSDDALRRWLVLSRDTILDQIPADRAIIAAVGPLLYGGDRTTGILSVRPFKSAVPFQMTVTWHAESTHVVRGRIASGQVDTLGSLRGGRATMQQVVLVRPGFNPVQLLPNPLVSADQALLFPDGWIAVVRLEPFRVDWRSAGGQWTRGAALPITLSKTTERDKRAAMERRFGERGRATPTSVFTEWPTQLPPYLDDALLALPTGHLAIRRTPVAGSRGVEYDVIDRLGVLKATIQVSTNERIVGFGLHSAYLAVTDNDDIVILERRPLPPIPL